MMLLADLKNLSVLQGMRNIIVAIIGVVVVSGVVSPNAAAENGSTCLRKDQLSDLRKLRDALDGRRMVVEKGKPYPKKGAKLESNYNGVIESGRTIALIKNVRDIGTGNKIHDTYLTGTFFYSKCHIITSRHGVNKMVEVKNQDGSQEKIVATEELPVGRVVADIEMGHIDGRLDKTSGRVIFAASMGNPKEVNGDLAILRLDRPLPNAQASEFLPYDDARYGDGSGREAVTYGYSFDLQPKGMQSPKIVSDLNCEVRSRSLPKSDCDVTDVTEIGYERAFNTTCIAAGGASGSPVFVKESNGDYAIRGIVTKAGLVDQASGINQPIGTLRMRGFTAAELQRLNQIVQQDIQKNGLTGCQ